MKGEMKSLQSSVGLKTNLHDTRIGSFPHKSTQIVEDALANPIHFAGRRDVEALALSATKPQ